MARFLDLKRIAQPDKRMNRTFSSNVIGCVCMIHFL